MAEPKIVAAFRLDEAGQPRFVPGDTDRSLKHYEIELRVDDAPSDVYNATFELDPTYYDPIRTVGAKDGTFKLDTTSYGDYVVTVRLHSKTARTPLKVSLSRALQSNYAGTNASKAVQAALLDILKH